MIPADTSGTLSSITSEKLSNISKQTQYVLDEISKRGHKSTAHDSFPSDQVKEKSMITISDRDDDSSSEISACANTNPKPAKKCKNGVEYYEIEAVLDHKIVRKSAKSQSVQILVKWTGYDEPTWENFKDFA
jgi:hypothetical protein